MAAPSTAPGSATDPGREDNTKGNNASITHSSGELVLTPSPALQLIEDINNEHHLAKSRQMSAKPDLGERLNLWAENELEGDLEREAIQSVESMQTRQSLANGHDIDDRAVRASWPVPVDLWIPIDPVPPLPRELLPRTVEAFAFGKPEVFSPTALAAAALATCSIAASDNVRLVINPTWRESFRIWIALYGPSSAAKSPVINTTLRPLLNEQQTRLEEYRQELARWEAAKKAAAKSGAEFDDPKPLLVRYFTNNATIEALTEIEKHNPHGGGFTHDELSALIAAMDGPYKEKSNSQRGDWLKGYDGGVFFSDRIGRGEVIVSNHSFAILGAITTDKLTRLVRDMVADGLMSRMQLVSMPVLPPSADLEAMPFEIYAEFERLVSRLVNNRPGKPLDVILTDAGRTLLGESKRRWQEEAILQAERLPRYAERLGKLTGFAARLALGFAIIEAAEVPGVQSAYREIDMPRAVESDQMGRACAFVDYLSQHDLAFYAAAAGQDISPPTVMARQVGAWLLQVTRESFLLGDLTRGIPDWRSYSAIDQFATLELLDHLGWIWTANPNYFRGLSFVRGVVWQVNPEVHRVFAARADLARRAAAEAKRRLTEAVSAHRGNLND